MGVIHMSRSEPSPVYAQVLALGVLLFGTSVAVAILLNIAAYLGFCALLIRIGPKVGLVTPAASATSVLEKGRGEESSWPMTWLTIPRMRRS